MSPIPLRYRTSFLRLERTASFFTELSLGSSIRTWWRFSIGWVSRPRLSAAAGSFPSPTVPTTSPTRWRGGSRGLGVETRLNSRVEEIKGAGIVEAVRTRGGLIPAEKVVLATGGVTYPKTGSSGDGYRMAAELGHRIIPPKPALTAMISPAHWVREMQGLSLKNIEARLLAGDGRLIGRQFGEMLFTHFGVSGPIILTLSRKALDAVGGGLELSIDLKPALSVEQLDRRFIRDFASNKQFKNYLVDLLPRLMIPPFIAMSGIPSELPVNRITSGDRQKMIGLLHDLRLPISGLRPPEEALVTAGGVDIRQIDPRTMESKLVQGLYLVGEMIDIDAATGGYNLQAAFSTGWVAGESAARA